MITYKQATKDAELLQILKLQNSNLPMAISSEEKATEGFLTAQHDFELLKQMNSLCMHTIAMDEDTLVGYALSMHPSFRNEIEILKPMFTEIDLALANPSNDLNPTTLYIVMGQVCIDKAYRKQGVFKNLYTHMQDFVASQFTTIITEVDAANTRSLHAHYAIGFKTLSKFTSGNQKWELIYL